MSEGGVPSGLEETIEALGSAQKLVAQLQERVEFLSTAGWEELKKVADAMHSIGCEKRASGEDCLWNRDRHTMSEPWFSGEHKAWVVEAERAVRATGRSAEDLLDAIDLCRKAGVL